MTMDYNFSVVVAKLIKSRKKWERISRILIWEGVNVQMSGKIFKSVVQAVILLGSETWVATLCINRMLGTFHHRVACF